MTYDHKKKQSIATDLEVTDIKELSDKDNKTDIINMFHKFRKVGGNMSIMREMEAIKKPKWNF